MFLVEYCFERHCINPQGQPSSFWLIGMIIYCYIVVQVNVEIFYQTNSHTIYSFCAQFLSICAFFLMYYVQNKLAVIPVFRGTFFWMWQTPPFYLCLILLVMTQHFAHNLHPWLLGGYRFLRETLQARSKHSKALMRVQSNYQGQPADVTGGAAVDGKQVEGQYYLADAIISPHKIGGGTNSSGGGGGMDEAERLSQKTGEVAFTGSIWGGNANDQSQNHINIETQHDNNNYYKEALKLQPPRQGLIDQRSRGSVVQSKIQNYLEGLPKSNSLLKSVGSVENFHNQNRHSQPVKQVGNRLLQFVDDFSRKSAAVGIGGQLDSPITPHNDSKSGNRLNQQLGGGGGGGPQDSSAKHSSSFGGRRQLDANRGLNAYNNDDDDAEQEFSRMEMTPAAQKQIDGGNIVTVEDY